MILVGQYDSPYVRRVAVSLHLLGIPFDRDTRSGFADAEAMRAINPVGRIPSLILDGGEVIIDSAAILDHLDETVGPARALVPPRGPERRRALFLVSLATGTIDKTGAYAYEKLLRPPEKVFEPWLRRCLTQVESGLAALEQRAGDGWFLGERPMQPDVTAACLVGLLGMRIDDGALPRETFGERTHPRLWRLAARCEELPAFVATRAAAGEVMPRGL